MLTVGSQPLRRRLDLLRRRMEWLDHHAFVLFPAYLAIFIVSLFPRATRPLWYDELFTYYLSTSHSVGEFVARLLHIDLNPPLSYLFVFGSLRVFGDSSLAARLPSIAAFFIAGLVAFEIVRGRLGGFWGLTAMVLTWSCGFLDYATEARPYALLLLFFSLALLCWMRLPPNRFSRYHWALSGSLAAMLLCHCFAAFYLAPFFIAELVRSIERKRIERAAWLALALPLPILLTYIPLVLRAQTILIPPAFLPSWSTALLFYAIFFLAPGFVVLVPFVALLLTRSDQPKPRILSKPEVALFSAGAAIPLLLMAYSAWAQAAFWGRYGICAVAAFSIGITCMAARKTNRALVAGALAALISIGAFSLETAKNLVSALKHPAIRSNAFREIHPELPFVDASGLSFLEMDHYEPAGFIKRLYYLTDRDAAVRYAHATIFEGMAIVKQNFPVRANVALYKTFVVQHPHFLVLGTPGYPENWLLKKLKADGADISLLWDQSTGYHDSMLFEVRMRTIP